MRHFIPEFGIISPEHSVYGNRPRFGLSVIFMSVIENVSFAVCLYELSYARTAYLFAHIVVYGYDRLPFVLVEFYVRS